MSLLSWNCRGLGNLRTVRDLHNLVKDKKQSFLFLMETLSKKNQLEKVRSRLGFDGLFVVDPVGKSGGIALLWKEANTLEIFNYSRSYIHAIVKDDEGNPHWILTGFYGHPDSARRGESWALLKHLKSLHSLPFWLCAGDFNEILEQSEKDGATVRRESQMLGFREVLEGYGLSDLGFIGPRFTWCNNRDDGYFIRERLDQVVANLDWCSRFSFVAVSVLAACASDHNPILVSYSDHLPERQSYNRGFKFEAG